MMLYVLAGVSAVDSLSVTSSEGNKYWSDFAQKSQLLRALSHHVRKLTTI